MNWMDLEDLAESFHTLVLFVGLRLLVREVCFRLILSESSLLNICFMFWQHGKLWIQSCRRWPLKNMYIQGLQQLFKEASNAVMVVAGFSDSVWKT